MQPDDIETTRQIDALRAFASSAELAQLRQQAAAAKSAPDELDFLDLLGVFWRESVHSNFLGWLLNPAASHGVGDYFLKKFLLATAERSSDLWNKIEKANWSGAAVYLEWHAIVNGVSGYLDILIVNPEPPILCAIENKVFSPESVGQLSHYRKALENDYPNFTRHLVFLSPDGRHSQEATERDVWARANYTTVRHLVEKTIANNADSISEDVRVFLRQYATTLRRKIVPEAAEIQQLVRKIYLENRDVIELIYRHKPNYGMEAREMFSQAIADHGDWVPDATATNYLRFRSACWDQFAITRTGAPWFGAADGSLLMFDFWYGNAGAGSLTVQLNLWGTSNRIIGQKSGDDSLRAREKIVEAANRNPDVFNLAPIQLQSDMTRLFTKELVLGEQDLSRWDSRSVRDKIMAWVDDFHRNDFRRINEVIINCLREYEAGQSLPQGQ